MARYILVPLLLNEGIIQCKNNSRTLVIITFYVEQQIKKFLNFKRFIMGLPVVFEEFERAIMCKLLEEDTPINKVLREQYKYATVVNRDFTGVGFFTHLSIPSHVITVKEPIEYGYGDVRFMLNGSVGGGVVLFIEHGVMTCLEGYAYTEWPKVITSFELESFHENHSR